MPSKKMRSLEAASAASSSSAAAAGKPFLAANKISRLCRILGETNSEVLQRADIEFAQKTVSYCATELDRLLHGKKFNLDKMKEWEQNWTEVLTEATENYEWPEKDIQEFVKAVSNSIVTPPCITSYYVSGKHGSEIEYQLFAFETKEADGKTQKILATRYRILSGYDEREGWSLTSRKEIAKSCSFQQHLKNIEEFRVPDELPLVEPGDSGSRLFWSEDEGPGIATFYRTSEADCKPLTLKQVLKEKPKWQIVVSMTETETFY